MNKKLVKNEEEFIAIFSDWYFHDIESFLGIEFAFEDGTYHSDFTFDGTNPDNEDQEVSKTIFRKNSENHFPEYYPCIVLYANDIDYDRTGKIEFKFLEYVYLKDFEEVPYLKE